MRTLIAIALVICATIPVTAQKVKTVECEYTYHAPENITLEQAKRTAIERARIQAIADEFGTNISQTNITNISSAKVDFQSIGMSEVNGEWLEDLSEPEMAVDFIDGMFVITVRVKGKARELTRAQADCVVRVLRNGKEDRFESETFFSGDQFYISFHSPANGYIAAYLSDGKGTVSCLLPYPNQTDANYPIKANRRYLLFDPEEGDDYTEEYYLTCGNTPENNQIFLIFSPNKFTKALDRQATAQSEELLLPRELPEAEFQKWLAKCRRRDPEMQVIRKHITITNQ